LLIPVTETRLGLGDFCLKAFGPEGWDLRDLEPTRWQNPEGSVVSRSFGLSQGGQGGGGANRAHRGEDSEVPRSRT
jgi:hypothetical protein